MNGLTDIYSKSKALQTKRNKRKAVLFYALAAVIFACICTAFLLLYILLEVNIFVCASVCIVVTIAFMWFSVLFFGNTYKRLSVEANFYKVQANSISTNYRGEYLCSIGACSENGLSFTKLIFKTSEGEKAVLLLKDEVNPFKKNAVYYLSCVGNKVTAYAEARNA